VNINISLDHQLVEKLPSKTVLGKTYNDVLHVLTKLNATVPTGGNVPLDYSLNVYYARGVGIIEGQSATTAGIGVTRKLIEYKLK
jgi:hypothetical protein